MADLGKLTAPRRTVAILDQEWIFTPLTFGDNEQLLEDLEAQWPKPLATAKKYLEGLSEPERIELLKLALGAELRPRKATLAEFEDWKHGPIGGPRAWLKMLLPANSTITIEQAWMLWDAADEPTHRLAWGVNEIPLGNSSAPLAGAAAEA